MRLYALLISSVTLQPGEFERASPSSSSASPAGSQPSLTRCTPLESYVKKKDYSFHKVLGHGAFGEVKQATWTRPQDGEKLEVAVKVIKKKALKGDMAAVFDEVEVLEGLDHPNIGELAARRSLAETKWS